MRKHCRFQSSLLPVRTHGEQLSLVLVAQSCPPLHNLMDCSQPGSSVHGVLQARILEGVPFPSPEDFPDPGMEPVSPALAGGFFTPDLPRWRRQWHPTPVLLPGKSRGQRSLVGCSPWGREASDTTERLHSHFFLSCIGEGSGTPLQCSCLESPRDGGAWWAAVSGVAQRRTRLRRLSSSSSSATREPAVRTRAIWYLPE